MIFRELPIKGAWLIETEPISDERGFFARTFCREEFDRHGLETCVAQCSVSRNRRRGTLRGLHFQLAPSQETKLVRCTAGAVWDVIVDLRAGSSTFCKWHGLELISADCRAVYIPPGVAHGFQTLCDDSDVYYQMSVPYRPELDAGASWADPAFGIRWPVSDPILSPRDRAFPFLERGTLPFSDC